MTDSSIARRDFIRAGAAASATVAITRFCSAAALLGANERIRVGIIGPGDRGRSLIRQFCEQSRGRNAQLAAVCDLWNARRQQAAQMVKDLTGKEPLVYRNMEELFEARAVDAVIIATPDFSHAIQCAQAVGQGLDVYVEKPLAHLLEEARMVRGACLAGGRIVQVGTDSRSLGTQRSAAHYVRSGEFGRITSAELGWHVHQPYRWRRDKLVASLKESDTDWGRYQLNRPPRPFNARHYLEFRLFWPYSSGLPDQWLSHHADMVAHITGELYPASCVANGAICQWHDGRENVDSFSAVFEYPSGLQFRYSARHDSEAGGHFARFFSEAGTLDMMEGTVRPADGRSSGGGRAHAARALPELADESHMGNWLDCIRTRKQPAADITAGYSHSVVVAMAVKALQTGRKVSFDSATHELHLA